MNGFDLTASALVKVVGIGGAGGSVVARMLAGQHDGNGPAPQFVVMDADKHALDWNPCPNKVFFDPGGRGEDWMAMARQGAIESEEEIKKMVEDAHVVILTAGMGGTCGTACLPIVSNIARRLGVLVVCIVTTPLAMEGKRYMEKAHAALEPLLDMTDSVIVLPNEALAQEGGQELPFEDFFKLSCEALCTAVGKLCDMVLGLEDETAFFSFGFADIRGVLGDAGYTHFVSVRYRGSDRVSDAVKAMLDSPLFNNEVLDAPRMLVSFYVPPQTGYNDLDFARHLIQQASVYDALVQMDARVDESLGDEVRFTMLATGLRRYCGEEPVFQILDLCD